MAAAPIHSSVSSRPADLLRPANGNDIPVRVNGGHPIGVERTWHGVGIEVAVATVEPDAGNHLALVTAGDSIHQISPSARLCRFRPAAQDASAKVCGVSRTYHAKLFDVLTKLDMHWCGTSEQTATSVDGNYPVHER